MPYEIWKMIIIIMIANGQFEDLDELRRIPLFNVIIDDCQTFIVMKNLIQSFNGRRTYNFNDFWQSKTLDNVSTPILVEEIPQIWPLSVQNQFHCIKKCMEFKGDILSNVTIIGKKIQRVDVIMNGAPILRRWFLTSNVVSFKTFDCGILLGASHYSSVIIIVYADDVEKVFGRTLLLSQTDKTRLQSTDFESNEFYTDYRYRCRKTFMMYMSGMNNLKHAF